MFLVQSIPISLRYGRKPFILALLLDGGHDFLLQIQWKLADPALYDPAFLICEDRGGSTDHIQ